jgi:hypothetical protein
LNGSPCDQWWRRLGAGRPRIHALDEHQRADNAEEHHVAHRDQQLDLAQAAQHGEDLNADCRPDQAAGQQNAAHLEIDRPASPMGQNARERRGDDLIRLGCDGHRRGNSDQDQQGRHQEAAANPEHPRQKPHAPAQTKQKERVH